MSSALRVSTVASSVLRSSVSSTSFALKRAGFRYYSSVKPKTLKETFAAQIPGEIEKIKKLRKCVCRRIIIYPFRKLTEPLGSMALRSSARSPLTKSTEVREA